MAEERVPLEIRRAEPEDAAELLFSENPAAIINNGEVYALASEF